MPKQIPENPSQLSEIKAGYLVMRLKPGEGLVIAECIEIRIADKQTAPETQLAIRAPKDFLIRKVK